MHVTYGRERSKTARRATADIVSNSAQRGLDEGRNEPLAAYIITAEVAPYRRYDSSNTDGHIPGLERHNQHYRTGDGFKFQISRAYSMIVRSLENFPEQATLMMAFCAHPSGSAYSAARSAWARA